MRVLVLNGPNLNLLGTREPDVYGDTTLEGLESLIEGWGADLGIETRFTQSNHEGEVIDAIHEAAGMDGLIINPGALTHTSRAIGDAISSVGVPAVEVHISNIKQREPWRAESLVAPSCVRTIFGRGVGGYQDALRHLQNRAAAPFETISYGPHRDNVGDLRRPDGEASGLLVLVHGGLWRQEYERDSTETLAVDLTGSRVLDLEPRIPERTRGRLARVRSRCRICGRLHHQRDARCADRDDRALRRGSPRSVGVGPQGG